MLRRPRSALANLSCPWDLRHCLAVPESHTSPGHGPDVAFFPGAQLWRRLWGRPPPSSWARRFYSAHTHLHGQSLFWVSGTAASLARVSKQQGTTGMRMKTQDGWAGGFSCSHSSFLTTVADQEKPGQFYETLCVASRARSRFLPGITPA